MSNGWTPGVCNCGHEGVKLLSMLPKDVDKTTKMFVEFLVTEAHNRRENAGFNGSMHDGGASALESEVECWIAGMINKTPNRWDSLICEMNQAADPEFATYQRLKAKFDK